MTNIKSKRILGFEIFDGRKEQLVTHLDDTLRHGQACLFYANSNLLQHCHGEAQDYVKPDIVIANDGIALDAVAMALSGSRFTENLNGTDFTPYFLQHSQVCRRTFLLGGRPGVAAAAAEAFTTRFGLQIVGHANGFDDMADLPGLLARINAVAPDVVLVALGNPRQEAWILANRQSLDAKLLVGVGALLDFVSGSVKRAPDWVQRLHLEWLYRLCGEPKRLLRRYTVEMALFFILCLRWRFSNAYRVD
ncbi:WecB/TagA/CpsF family glycosyltransferase [Pseudaeromonas sp. ZJS20]|uniref:WecB/TagA/CpsF family glycosyltransferase n=1 Tax=Pseudaeromonas aegiceratis TaxID=3153928 RepID=UPI00390C6635